MTFQDVMLQERAPFVLGISSRTFLSAALKRLPRTLATTGSTLLMWSEEFVIRWLAINFYSFDNHCRFSVRFSEFFFFILLFALSFLSFFLFEFKVLGELMQLGRNYFLYHYRILRKEFGKGVSHDNRSLLGNLFGTFKALKSRE